MVYRWARQANLQMADAEDVTQEVFRVVATRLNTYRPTGNPGSFRAWLWGISRNILKQHFGRVQNRPLGRGGSTAVIRLASVPDMLDSVEPPADPDTDKSFVFRILRSIRNDFQEKTWQAFWRTTIEEESAVDVGSDLVMSSKAVRQAKFRVLTRVREEMAIWSD